MKSLFNISILTTSRSEFGLLKDLIKYLSIKSNLTLFIGGSHLIDDSSLKEIEDFTKLINVNKVTLDHKVNTSSYLTASKKVEILGEIEKLLINYFDELHINLLILLGDRWEILSGSISALFKRIPVAHISGGEITEGAIDESIRHAITKMSHIHFVSCQNYARNISLMGEEDWRISISGETGLDWIHNEKIIDFKQTKKMLKIKSNKNLILFTYHPISYGNDKDLKDQLDQLKIALENLKKFIILITGPGYEIGSEFIREKFKILAKNFDHIYYFEHLGREKYLSVMKGSCMVLGNSSSGIFEAPSLGIPSINIGNRQNGRETASSTISIPCLAENIIQSVNEIVKNKNGILDNKIKNPYDPYLDGKNSLRVAESCIKVLKNINKNKLINKKFSNNVNPLDWNILFKN